MPDNDAHPPSTVPDAPPMSTVELAVDRLKTALYVALVLLLFVGAFFFNSIFIFIDSGEAGVRWRRLQGGTQMVTYDEGFHLIWPWDRMYVYDVRVQESDLEALIYAQDGLEIRAQVSVRFRPRAERLPWLHKDIGPEYIKKLVEPEIISTLRKVLGNFTPSDIYAKDEEGLLQELAETMEADFDSEYVTLDKFLVKQLLLPEHIQAAIQDKLEEEQRAKAYYFILEKEQYERERRIIEATGIRDFEEIAGVNILRWRGLEVTEALATSENSKVVIAGTGSDQLPIILNTEGAAAPAREATAAAPEPVVPSPRSTTPTEPAPPADEEAPQ
ncbi:MAG: prohibitin family protein [Alphaproteobacteria bacterium]|nr:prohibitin family protein [Alphaproteobacteria bacterium]